MKSFIVEIWSIIFDGLRSISPFQMIRVLIPSIRGSYRFVDGWVLGNFILSIFLFFICSAPDLQWWESIAFGYGVIRIFEIFIYQINVLLFDEYRVKKAGGTYTLRGYRRIVILLLHNYIEIIFWFALFYRNIGYLFETGGVDFNQIIVSLNFSFVTMTTFGNTVISPKDNLGISITFIQSIIGLVMALLILSRFISLIPTPGTSDEFEK